MQMTNNYTINVSKGTVSKAPLGKLPLVETPFSVICVDIVGPIMEIVL